MGMGTEMSFMVMGWGWGCSSGDGEGMGKFLCYGDGADVHYRVTL